MRWTISPKLWLTLIGPFVLWLSLLVFPFDLVAQSPPANPGDVVINEIAWGGTAARMAAAGWHAMSVDLRGHGDTPGTLIRIE